MFNQESKSRIKQSFIDFRLKLRKLSDYERMKLAVLKEQMFLSMHNGFSFFTYRKADGTIRETLATLDTEIRPPYDFAGVNYRKPLIVTAWCQDANNWRSFRVDRVVKLHI